MHRELRLLFRNFADIFFYWVEDGKPHRNEMTSLKPVLEGSGEALTHGWRLLCLKIPLLCTHSSGQEDMRRCLWQRSPKKSIRHPGAKAQWYCLGCISEMADGHVQVLSHQYGQEVQFGCSRVSILASPAVSFTPLTMAPANCHFFVLPLHSGFVVRLPRS
jgi:hypothetical protein